MVKRKGRRGGAIRGSVIGLILCFSFAGISAGAEVALDRVSANYRVRGVDLLLRVGVTVNGAGPLLVRADPARNRVILVNTHTSSVSIIDGRDGGVVNIPIGNRVSEHVKNEALAIDGKTGNVYIIGNRAVHVVFVDEGRSLSIDTGDQYEMVSVYEKNGDAFLVGQGSETVAWVQLARRKVHHIRWVHRTEPKSNTNQTPPPPIRKVVVDQAKGRVVAVDGYTSTLHTFNARTGKALKKRTLRVKGGERWHYVGYDQKRHQLYLVIETASRVAEEAIRIAPFGGKDRVAQLPGLREAVGISYNSKRQEIYIPYDNNPLVHVVDFKGGRPSIGELAVPNYGNDASCVDEKHNRLYVASWGYGQVAVIDLVSRKTIRIIEDQEILPHMFAMAFNPGNRKLYIPVGATAVNGSFGASVNELDPETEKKRVVHTGWSPTAIVPASDGSGAMVFNSENEMAKISRTGETSFHELPVRFINNGITAGDGKAHVSYGAHQSFWPQVYIWPAKNGILTVDEKSLRTYDRRIPRMAQDMAFDKNGKLYLLQNNWGGEEQFLFSIPDSVRRPNLPEGHIKLGERVNRETTQRVLKYDPQTHWLYILKTGETDASFGTLQVFDIDASKVLISYPTGRNPTHLVFDDRRICVTNFDSDTLTCLQKDGFAVTTMKTDAGPFKVAQIKDELLVMNHKANTLEVFRNGKSIRRHPLPFEGFGSNMAVFGNRLFIAGHTKGSLFFVVFDPKRGSFEEVFAAAYPYGETTVDTDNSSFYMRGQFGDGIFELNQIHVENKRRIWLTDYLSGRVFIIERK